MRGDSAGRAIANGSSKFPAEGFGPKRDPLILDPNGTKLGPRWVGGIIIIDNACGDHRRPLKFGIGSFEVAVLGVFLEVAVTF